MNKLKTFESKSNNVVAASEKIRKFLDDILDEKSFVEMDVFVSDTSFIDDTETLGEGVVTGYGSINDMPVYLFAQNQEVLKGSFGKAHADKIIKVINQAVKNATPLIAIIDSNGARIGEGVTVLEAYSAVVNAITIASGEIPLISVVKGNCVGLMSTVPALSDYVFMSEESVMSLGAPAVVAAKVNSTAKLTDILGAKTHFSTSGIGNYIFKDAKSLIQPLKSIISVLCDIEVSNEDDANRVSPALNSAIDAKSLIMSICDNKKFLPYSSEYAKELICGFTAINGIHCGIAVCDSSVKQTLSRDSLSKLNDFVEILDKFNIPFISLVDSAGIETSLSEEQSGIARDLARLMKSISISGMAKVAVITGKAIGAAYNVLASKSIGYDYVLAFNSAEITPIDPAVAVNIVYTEELKLAKDPYVAREELMKKYSDMVGNPYIAAKDGYIDNVIEPSNIRPYIASALLMLLGL